MTAKTAEQAGALSGLDEVQVRTLQAIPYRGLLPTTVPIHPLIYRFNKLIDVNGTIWKEMIGKESGGGIMSAIDCDMTLERQPDLNGAGLE